MKVLMIGWEMPPKFNGGTGRHCYELSKTLSKKCSISYIIPSFNLPENPPKEFNIIPINIDKNGFDDNYLGEIELVKKYNNKIIKYFKNKKFDYDIIHGHDWIVVSSLERLKKEYNKPVIMTYHSLEKDRTGKIISESEIFHLEKKGGLIADKIISVSDILKQDLKNIYGIDEEIIKVIPNGIDFSRIDPYVNQDKENNKIIFIGRMTEQKGAEYLLLAAKQVINKHPETDFVFIGQGYLLPSLKKFSDLLGISSHINFMGFLKDEELVNHLSKSTVLVVPSIYEPFGIVPLEGMRAKTPVILSKKAGISGLVSDECLLINPDNSIELSNSIIKLMENKDLRNEMIRKGFDKTENFTWSSIAQKTINLYEKIIH